MIYRCPLCNKEYNSYAWLIKHINNYSEQEKRKIFINQEKGTTSYQGSLENHFEN